MHNAIPFAPVEALQVTCLAWWQPGSIRWCQWGTNCLSATCSTDEAALAQAQLYVCELHPDLMCCLKQLSCCCYVDGRTAISPSGAVSRVSVSSTPPVFGANGKLLVVGAWLLCHTEHNRVGSNARSCAAVQQSTTLISQRQHAACNSGLDSRLVYVVLIPGFAAA